MNSPSAVLKARADGRGGELPPLPRSTTWRRGRPQAIYSVGLWVFMGVATALFSLFITAYVMRLSGADASAIAMPHQLWLSTSALLLGSISLQQAAQGAARRWLWAGGLCALAFLGLQGWAWQALLAQQVSAVGNPAGSFFYLLTTMHGLHVAGGLVAWALVARAVQRAARADELAWRVGLCARYWHFLLLVWLALFACFTWITPDVARVICRTA